MTNTESTLRMASKALAKAVCKIRETDAALADRLTRVIADEVQRYREVKTLDRYEVEREARMLAAG